MKKTNSLADIHKIVEVEGKVTQKETYNVLAIHYELAQKIFEHFLEEMKASDSKLYGMISCCRIEMVLPVNIVRFSAPSNLEAIILHLNGHEVIDYFRLRTGIWIKLQILGKPINHVL